MPVRRSRPRGRQAADKIDDELDDLKTDLVAAYGEIADSTWGDLIVVGYPDIFPDRDEKDECYKCGWLGENKKRGTAEKTGVWHVQNGLERTIREAAEEADVDFISIRDALDGREMCTRKSVINKITPSGKDRVHPNAGGQKLIADTVRDAAKAAAVRVILSARQALYARSCTNRQGRLGPTADNPLSRTRDCSNGQGALREGGSASSA